MSTSGPPKASASDFPPATFEAWRERVERELKGVPFDKALVATTREGLRIAPLYTERDWPGPGTEVDRSGFPGRYPFVRGAGRDAAPGERFGAPFGTWTRTAHWDLAAARAEVDSDVAGGATGIWVPLDRAGRGVSGGTAGADGVPIRSVDDLRTTLGAAAAKGTWVATTSGGNGLAVAALLAAWSADGGPAGLLVGADPIGGLARDGSLPTSLDAALAEIGQLGLALGAHPTMRAVTISTEPYVAAGADAAFELALALSAGAAYAKAFTEAGLGAAEAGRQMAVELMIGTDVFLEVAKLRAARLCFAKLFAAYEEGVVLPPLLVARTSPVMLTTRDPWVNILRATHGTFAAAIGGAEAIVTAPFDEAIGAPDPAARRLARNTAHILREESHIGYVMDPAGGSSYVEAITEKLARLAWSHFVELEREGGIASALTSGALAGRLAAAWTARAADVARRREAIVGVSEFANLGEVAVTRTKGPSEAELARLAARDREPPRAAIAELAGPVPARADAFERLVSLARRGATVLELARALDRTGPPATTPSLPRHRLAEGFEALRDEVEGGANQPRPRVLLAALGSPADHGPRATWITSLLAAAGIEAVVGVGTMDGASGPVVCLCGSDEDYGRHAEAAVRALRAGGARHILFAGAPRDREAALRAAGVDAFVYLGCDVLAVLRGVVDALKGAS